jgi:GPH family glycoside/pentoside/hexuronide:cation symporter
MSSQKNVNYSTLFPYALIALPVAFAGIPIYLFIPDYYHTEFGLSLTILSMALFGLRFVDACVDPLIGVFCDRYGHYKKTLVFGMGFVFSAGFWMLCVPIISPILLNLIVGVFLATLGFSFFTIYVNTVGALWQKSADSKARLVSFREGITIVGVLIASALPFLLSNIFNATVTYGLYALVFTVLMVFGVTVFYSWLVKQKQLFKRAKNMEIAALSLKPYWQLMGRHGKFLFSSYGLSALGSAVPGVMLVFYSQYVLKSEAYTGLYLCLYFMGAILCIPMIRNLSLKFGAIKVWRCAIYAAIIIFMLAFFLTEGDILQFSVISFLSGGCFAAEIILPNILVAEFIDHPKRSKLGNGFYALLAFLSKFSFALATIVSLPFLQMSLADGSSVGPAMTVKWIYCALPCVLKFIATIMLWRWEKCGAQTVLGSKI